MNIDFKHPKYVLPLIVLPFLFIFFYIYKDLFKDPATSSDHQQESLQGKIADVSQQVKDQALADKLLAYKNQYRSGDGYTAIGRLQEESNQQVSFENFYNEQEKQQLDSLQNELRKRQASSFIQLNQKSSEQADDLELSKALGRLTQQQTTYPPSTPSTLNEMEDPMELFRKQMMLADSFAKANDPSYQQQQRNLQEKKQQQLAQQSKPKFSVQKYAQANPAFNTLKKQDHDFLIKALIDENRTVFTDSRLRIRILEDIFIAGQRIEKGTFLYAKISGFSAQRVELTISSVMYKGEIIPIELKIYDHDGQAGLYVPNSAFREFTRDLTANSTQGININTVMEKNSQLFMSTLQRMFQSSSSALSKHIRRNRAHIKYNSLIYLLDSSASTHNL